MVEFGKAIWIKQSGHENIFSISKLCIFRAFNKGPEFETEMNEDRKYSIITDIGQ